MARQPSPNWLGRLRAQIAPRPLGSIWSIWSSSARGVPPSPAAGCSGAARGDLGPGTQAAGHVRTGCRCRRRRSSRWRAAGEGSQQHVLWEVDHPVRRSAPNTSRSLWRRTALSGIASAFVPTLPGPDGDHRPPRMHPEGRATRRAVEDHLPRRDRRHGARGAQAAPDAGSGPMPARATRSQSPGPSGAVTASGGHRPRRNLRPPQRTGHRGFHEGDPLPTGSRCTKASDPRHRRLEQH